MKTIKQYCDEAFKNATDKGFHDKDRINLNMHIEHADTKKESLENIEYMRNISIIKDLALVITEISEAIEAIRNDRFAIMREGIWKETFEEEIADTFIRLFDLCGAYEIDIERYIQLKMDYNTHREVLHGKKM